MGKLAKDKKDKPVFSADKCPKVWEKARRERLKSLFEELSRLLPNHDPAVPPSRPEIITKAMAHIRDLQAQNEELLNSGFDQVYKKKLETWKKRVKDLLCRVDQLSKILRTANISLPPVAVDGATWPSPRPKFWTDKVKLPEEKIQELVKQLSCPKKRVRARRKVKVKKGIIPEAQSKENQPTVVAVLSDPGKKVVKSPKKPTATSTVTQVPNIIQAPNFTQPGTFILTNQGNLVPLIAPTPNVLTPVIINRPPPLVVLQTPPRLPVVFAKPPPNKRRIERETTVMTFANKRPIPALSKQSHSRKEKCAAHKTIKESKMSVKKTETDVLAPILNPSGLVTISAVSPTAAFLNSFPVVTAALSADESVVATLQLDKCNEPNKEKKETVAGTGAEESTSPSKTEAAEQSQEPNKRSSDPSTPPTSEITATQPQETKSSTTWSYHSTLNEVKSSSNATSNSVGTQISSPMPPHSVSENPLVSLMNTSVSSYITSSNTPISNSTPNSASVSCPTSTVLSSSVSTPAVSALPSFSYLTTSSSCANPTTATNSSNMSSTESRNISSQEIFNPPTVVSVHSSVARSSTSVTQSPPTVVPSNYHVPVTLATPVSQNASKASSTDISAGSQTSQPSEITTQSSFLSVPPPSCSLNPPSSVVFTVPLAASSVSTKPILQPVQSSSSAPTFFSPISTVASSNSALPSFTHAMPKSYVYTDLSTFSPASVTTVSASSVKPIGPLSISATPPSLHSTLNTKISTGSALPFASQISTAPLPSINCTSTGITSNISVNFPSFSHSSSVTVPKISTNSVLPPFSNSPVATVHSSTVSAPLPSFSYASTDCKSSIHAILPSTHTEMATAFASTLKAPLSSYTDTVLPSLSHTSTATVYSNTVSASLPSSYASTASKSTEMATARSSTVNTHLTSYSSSVLTSLSHTLPATIYGSARNSVQPSFNPPSTASVNTIQSSMNQTNLPPASHHFTATALGSTATTHLPTFSHASIAVSAANRAPPSSASVLNSTQTTSLPSFPHTSTAIAPKSEAISIPPSFNHTQTATDPKNSVNTFQHTSTAAGAKSTVNSIMPSLNYNLAATAPKGSVPNSKTLTVPSLNSSSAPSLHHTFTASASKSSVNSATPSFNHSFTATGPNCGVPPSFHFTSTAAGPKSSVNSATPSFNHSFTATGANSSAAPSFHHTFTSAASKSSVNSDTPSFSHTLAAVGPNSSALSSFHQASTSTASNSSVNIATPSFSTAAACQSSNAPPSFHHTSTAAAASKSNVNIPTSSTTALSSAANTFLPSFNHTSTAKVLSSSANTPLPPFKASASATVLSNTSMDGLTSFNNSTALSYPTTVFSNTTIASPSFSHSSSGPVLFNSSTALPSFNPMSTATPPSSYGWPMTSSAVQYPPMQPSRSENAYKPALPPSANLPSLPVTSVTTMPQYTASAAPTATTPLNTDYTALLPLKPLRSEMPLYTEIPKIRQPYPETTEKTARQPNRKTSCEQKPTYFPKETPDPNVYLIPKNNVPTAWSKGTAANQWLPAQQSQKLKFNLELPGSKSVNPCAKANYPMNFPTSWAPLPITSTDSLVTSAILPETQNTWMSLPSMYGDKSCSTWRPIPPDPVWTSAPTIPDAWKIPDPTFKYPEPLDVAKKEVYSQESMQNWPAVLGKCSDVMSSSYPSPKSGQKPWVAGSNSYQSGSKAVPLSPNKGSYPCKTSEVKSKVAESSAVITTSVTFPTSLPFTINSYTAPLMKSSTVNSYQPLVTLESPYPPKQNFGLDVPKTLFNEPPYPLTLPKTSTCEPGLLYQGSPPKRSFPEATCVAPRKDVKPPQQPELKNAYPQKKPSVGNEVPMWNMPYIPQNSNVIGEGLTWPQTAEFCGNDSKSKAPINWMTDDQRNEPLDDPFHPKYHRVDHNMLDFCFNAPEEDTNKSKGRKRDADPSHDYFGWISMKMDPLVVPSTLPTLVGDLALGGDPPPRQKKLKTTETFTNRTEKELETHSQEPFTNLAKNIFESQNENKNQTETVVLKNIFELPATPSGKLRPGQSQNSFLSVSQLVEPHEKGEYCYNQRAVNKTKRGTWKCTDKKVPGKLVNSMHSNNYSTEALLRNSDNVPDQDLSSAVPIFPLEFQQDNIDGSKTKPCRPRNQEFWKSGQPLKMASDFDGMTPTYLCSPGSFPLDEQPKNDLSRYPGQRKQYQGGRVKPHFPNQKPGKDRVLTPYGVNPPPTALLLPNPVMSTSLSQLSKQSENLSDQMSDQYFPKTPAAGDETVGPPLPPFTPLPPPTPGSSLANFNLSTIFPEMNKKRYQYS